jgi:uncharacterized protein YqjF (DUF2071 family)
VSTPIAHAKERHPGRWVMHMTWHELAFLHWAVDAAALRALLPAGLELDTLEGRAYVGVVPFRMSDVRPRAVPALPGVSAFPELNVRTYVICRGTPGVWFFSLDAGSRLAVRAARAGFHLPYFDADMTVARAADGWIDYRSRRVHRGAPPAELDARYRPAGPVFLAQEGTLERWLTDRMTLYAATPRGRILRADIHHPPWPLQPATAELRICRMTEQVGLALPPEPPLAHYADRVEVVAWWREQVWPVT